MTDTPWTSFVAAETTLGPSPGAREQWRRGRSTYAVWIARVADAAVLRRWDAVADAAAPFVRRVSRVDAHVTLWVAGFPTAAPVLDDDVAHARLDAQERALRSGPLRLRLEVRGASAFTTCATVEVADPHGDLAALRQRLGGGEVRFAPYAPHLTVGTFPSAAPTPPIVAALQPLRALAPLAWEPDAVELVGFDAATEGAPLRTLRRVVLRP